MNMDCEIISAFYYSNCLLEALKAKVLNPRTELHFCLPYKRPSRGIGSSHVLWEDDDYSYDFSDEEWDDSGKFWQYFWYRGCIRRWPKEFAGSFSAKRNRMAKKSWTLMWLGLKRRLLK